MRASISSNAMNRLQFYREPWSERSRFKRLEIGGLTGIVAIVHLCVHDDTSINLKYL